MIPLILSGNYLAFGLLLVALVLSLSCHEFGHAWVAKRFGDDTAERQGRLTLNPVAHIDPMGLMMVVLVGFGYARPVPTDPRNYNSIWAQLGVAAAGPLANLIIAFVALNLFIYGQQAGWHWVTTPGIDQFFVILVYINVLLMLFNLIPVGPLDGHYILPYFLPRDIARRYREINDRYGSLLLLGLVMLSLMGLPIFTWLRRAGDALIPYLSVF